jgi:hypothetical protein
MNIEQQIAVAAASSAQLLSKDGQLMQHALVSLCYFQWDSPIRQALRPNNSTNSDQ